MVIIWMNARNIAFAFYAVSASSLCVTAILLLLLVAFFLYYYWSNELLYNVNIAVLRSEIYFCSMRAHGLLMQFQSACLPACLDVSV